MSNQEQKSRLEVVENGPNPDQQTYKNPATKQQRGFYHQPVGWLINPPTFT